MPKAILVIGATGQQGKALITALSPVENGDPDTQYHILALTRSRSSVAARSLADRKYVTLVEGDLNDRDSIVKIFDDAQKSDLGAIWGVFAVLAYPGLGKNADGEEAQGKMLADLALEYRVSAFVYSSSLRLGPTYDDHEKLSRRAKVLVERHVKSLGENGLPWVIVRPGFFMENFLDTVGSITYGVLNRGLKPETSVDLIAAQDIGSVVAAIFENLDRCLHRELALISDSLTIKQIGDEYQRATSRPIPSIPKLVAQTILAINSGAKDITQRLDECYEKGKYPERESEIQISREICPRMTSFYEWTEQKQKDTQAGPRSGWNRVSIWKLITARS